MREDQQRGLDTVSVWRETDLFDAREQAALAWTESADADRRVRTRPTTFYAALNAAFNEAECVALTVAIGAINSWNRIAIGFRTKPARRHATAAT